MHRNWTLGMVVIPVLLGVVACSQATEHSVGKLELRANGEDFIRQGFTSKDCWQIEFDRVDANIQDVVAHQSDPLFNPETDKEITAKADALLTASAKVDLAERDETAAPILIGQAKTLTGRYNVLSLEARFGKWSLTDAHREPPLLLEKRFRLKFR